MAHCGGSGRRRKSAEQAGGTRLSQCLSLLLALFFPLECHGHHVHERSAFRQTKEDACSRAGGPKKFSLCDVDGLTAPCSVEGRTRGTPASQGETGHAVLRVLGRVLAPARSLLSAPPLLHNVNSLRELL